MVPTTKLVPDLKLVPVLKLVPNVIASANFPIQSSSLSIYSSPLCCLAPVSAELQRGKHFVLLKQQSETIQNAQRLNISMAQVTHYMAYIYSCKNKFFSLSQFQLEILSSTLTDLVLTNRDKWYLISWCTSERKTSVRNNSKCTEVEHFNGPGHSLHDICIYG